MKRPIGINWMCFGVFVVLLVVLINAKLTIVPDVLAYIVAGVGGLLFFVGMYKYKKAKIKDKDGTVGE